MALLLDHADLVACRPDADSPEPPAGLSDGCLEVLADILEENRHGAGLTAAEVKSVAAALRELLRTREWIRRLETHAARHGVEPCGHCGTRLYEWRTGVRCSECGEVRP